MQQLTVPVTAREQEFYADGLFYLQAVIQEFLCSLDLSRQWLVQRGMRDPIASCQARIKSEKSMTQKLRKRRLPADAEHALTSVYDAAGVRIICPFVDDVDAAVALIRAIPTLTVHRCKDYIRHPKENGYRSYHMIVTLPARFAAQDVRQVYLELQIRTIAMDCWASTEHQLRYKRDVPQQALLAEELRRCAAEIASTDLSLQTIREILDSIPPVNTPQ